MKVVITKASDYKYAKCAVIKSLKKLGEFIKENGDVIIGTWDYHDGYSKKEQEAKKQNFKPDFEIMIYDDYVE